MSGLKSCFILHEWVIVAHVELIFTIYITIGGYVPINGNLNLNKHKIYIMYLMNKPLVGNKWMVLTLLVYKLYKKEEKINKYASASEQHFVVPSRRGTK